jgi:hypothetical protein
MAGRKCYGARVFEPGMTCEEFVAAHVRVCTCPRVKKYDRAKSGGALHSLQYSRRKCAKKLWRYHRDKVAT